MLAYWVTESTVCWKIKDLKFSNLQKYVFCLMFCSNIMDMCCFQNFCTSIHGQYLRSNSPWDCLLLWSVFILCMYIFTLFSQKNHHWHCTCLFVIHLLMPAVSQTVHHQINGLMNNELKIMWMEAVVICLRYYPGICFKWLRYHENLWEQPQSQPRLDPVTF